MRSDLGETFIAKLYRQNISTEERNYIIRDMNESLRKKRFKYL
jgi:hypothetical protein